MRLRLMVFGLSLVLLMVLRPQGLLSGRRSRSLSAEDEPPPGSSPRALPRAAGRGAGEWSRLAGPGATPAKPSDAEAEAVALRTGPGLMDGRRLLDVRG